jgi:hypothetical protein
MIHRLAPWPRYEPLCVRLYVYPFVGQRHSVIVADGVSPPGPDEVAGIRL